MKNRILIFACAAIALASTTSCSRSIEDERADFKITEVKTILDKAAEDLNMPALSISRDEISQAMKGEHRYSNLLQENNCQNWCFKRTIQGAAEYRVNTMIIIGQLLPLYGTEVEPTNPRDMSGDGFVNADDLLLMLGFFGNTFDTVPLSEIEIVGGNFSGAGEAAFYAGDLTIEGESIPLISVTEGSNCFLQDYSLEPYTGTECLKHTKLTFETNIGTVKYYHLN